MYEECGDEAEMIEEDKLRLTIIKRDIEMQRRTLMFLIMDYIDLDICIRDFEGEIVASVNRADEFRGIIDSTMNEAVASCIKKVQSELIRGKSDE